MTKRRILFVDDEPSVLSGLRRMLRPMREEWDLAFADSGPSALETIAAGATDIVVSDMRMPGMNGLELLTEVQTRHPDVVRFVLSGQSELDTLIKSSGVAHQYLSKPCDPDHLREAIERAVNLRGRLGNNEVRRVVSNVGDLPVLPQVYADLTALLQSDEAPVEEVGDLIASDPALATKVLRLVNSSYFGLRSSVSSVSQAVTMLGLTAVGSLVLGITLFAELDGAKAAGLSPAAIWNRSLATAGTAKKIATSEGESKETREDAYLAGVLHAAGRLLLAAHLPAMCQEVNRLVERGAPLDGAEREVFGATHQDVGAYLLQLWGMPPDVVEAVAFQLEPSASGGTTFRPLTAVHVAVAATTDTIERRLDEPYLSTLETTDRVDSWLAMTVDPVDE